MHETKSFSQTTNEMKKKLRTFNYDVFKKLQVLVLLIHLYIHIKHTLNTHMFNPLAYSVILSFLFVVLLLIC
jgi:hypothetical protein